MTYTHDSDSKLTERSVEIVLCLLTESRCGFIQHWVKGKGRRERKREREREREREMEGGRTSERTEEDD